MVNQCNKCGKTNSQDASYCYDCGAALADAYATAAINPGSANKTAITRSVQKYLAKGQIDNAIAEYERSLMESPDGDKYNFLGDLYLRKSDKHNARDACYNAGFYYWKGGFSTKALAIFKKVLNIDPTCTDALLALGILSEEKGLITDAIKYYLVTTDILSRKGDKENIPLIYYHILSLSPHNVSLKNKINEILAKDGLSFEGDRVTAQKAASINIIDLLKKPKEKPIEREQRYQVQSSDASEGATYKLIIAATNGNIDEIKRYFSLGFNLNSKNIFRRTALMYAAEYGCYETVKYLLEKGAESDSGDNNNMTPLNYAVKAGHKDIINLLKDAQGKTSYRSAISANSGSRGCPSCGKEIVEGADFCIKCGYRLVSSSVCSKCKRDNPQDAVFCAGCGNKLKSPQTYGTNKVELPSYSQKESYSDGFDFRPLIKSISFAVGLLIVIFIFKGIFSGAKSNSEQSSSSSPSVIRPLKGERSRPMTDYERKVLDDYEHQDESGWKELYKMCRERDGKSRAYCVDDVSRFAKKRIDNYDWVY